MEATLAPSAALEVFFSYAHADERFRARLEKHLSTLRNEGVIVDWHDGLLIPGTDWDAEIRAHLDRADIILLLVSADFLASRYIASVELSRALERHDRGEAVVIPIVVKPCDWQTTRLGRLQALPRLARPITDWRSTEHAYLDVANGIRKIAEDLLADRVEADGSPSVSIKRVVAVLLELTPRGNADVERRASALERAADILAGTFADAGASVDTSRRGELAAVFGVPRIRDDDALRAVRAARDVQLALPALNDELRRHSAFELDVQIGVDTALLIAHESTDAHAAALDAAIDVRPLLRSAGTGEVVLGDSVYRAVSHAVRAASLDDRAWRLLDVRRGARKRPDRTRSPLVGRRWESSFLRDAFDRAVAERRCRLCVLSGAPGIGKSRLAHELARSIAGEAIVLRGACVESRPSYWPLLEVVRQVAAIEPTDSAARVRERLAALLPDDGALADADAIAGLLDLAEPSRDAEASARAVRRLLEVVGRETPLALIFDDVHFAKPAFLDLVAYLAEQSHGSPLLIVCLAWPEIDDLRPGWCEGLQNAQRIRVDSLVGRDLEELVENLLGGKTDPALRRQLATAADGNALFLEESLAMLVERGLLQLEDDVWHSAGPLPDDLVPDSLEALAATRIDNLTEAERSVVRAASVEGMVFHHDAVAQLTEERLHGEIDVPLAALVRKDIVRHDRAELPGEASSFHHLVLREAAYSSVPKSRRADLHKAFAAWLEATIGDRLGEYEETIAFHLECAHKLTLDALGPDAADARELGARAGRLLFSAGRRSIARGDIAGARSLLMRAAQLVDREDSEYAALLLDLAVTQMEAGLLRDAMNSYDAAVDAAHRADDVRTEWYARIQRSGLQADIDPEYGTKILLAEADEAQRVFAELEDELGLAKVWHRRGFLAAVDCRWRVAQGAFQRARRHARRVGAERDEAVASSMLFYCLVLGSAPVDSAVRRSETILAQTRFRGVAGVGLAALGSLHAMRGSFDEARALLERSTALLEDLGQTRRLNEATLFSAMANMLAGDASAAVSDLTAAYEETTSRGQRGLAASFQAQLAQAYDALGDLEAADAAALASAAAAADDDVVTQMRWRPVHAKVLARAGEFDAALRLVDEAIVLADATDDLNAQASTRADLAHVLALAGRSDDAAAAYAAALELYRRKGNQVAEAALVRSAADERGVDER